MSYDEIGTIATTPGEYDDEGNQITAPTYAEGWHVNTLQPNPEWADCLCDPQPETPHRVYAGGIRPVCYVFPDRETFESFSPQPEIEWHPEEIEEEEHV